MSLIAIGPGIHDDIKLFVYIPPEDGEQQPDAVLVGRLRPSSSIYGGPDKGKIRIEIEPSSEVPAYLGVPTITSSEVDGKQVIEIELVVAEATPSPSPTP